VPSPRRALFRCAACDGPSSRLGHRARVRGDGTGIVLRRPDILGRDIARAHARTASRPGIVPTVPFVTL
jgi:hypothetical protein